MKGFALSAALVAALSAVAGVGGPQSSAAADYRPPFDKSDYKGTVAVQLNAFYPLDKRSDDSFGGANVPYTRFTHDAWRQGMEQCAAYGINAFGVEIFAAAPTASLWHRMLAYAATITNADFKVGLFLDFNAKTPEDSVNAIKRIFVPFREELRSNPHVLRADGHPVVVVYWPARHKPEEWKRIFAALDAELGRMVYLADYWPLSFKRGGAYAGPEHFERELRRYLPCFDGVSNYGSSGLESQKSCAEVLKRVMGEWPQKIYEGGLHFTYTQHSNMCGLEVHLSHEWRGSVDTYFASDPDSEQITNLFDHHENSLVLPCYEREDFVLRYLEWALHKWKGRKFRFAKTPEIVLTNHNMIQLGWENLDFEVMAFPVDSKAKDLTVTLQLCDTSGKVLREFAPRKMTLDDFRCESYSVPSTDFVGERGIVPRVKYVWQGKVRLTDYNPMTLISPSLRSYHMYWARSTRNRLATNGRSGWTMGGIAQGGTLVSNGGQTVFSAHLANTGWTLPSGGYAYTTVKRDWSDFYRTNDGRNFCAMTQAFDLPDPGAGLHWYHLEIENSVGRKAQTLPVWHVNGSRPGMVEMPVKKEDGTVATYRIEAARVPYWHYPCDNDDKMLLLDVSGYRHNGRILKNGTAGWGGGFLGHNGYNHYHNGPMKTPEGNWQSRYARDADGRGYLSFNGSNDYAAVMFGTAFPGASTYEIEVRPAELGREMGLFGSGNNQISIDVLADGCVRAARRSENEGVAGAPRKGEFVNREVVSETRLEVGKWTKIQAVYDLRKLRLYVGGKLQGEVESAPISAHEWQTHLLIGAKCTWVWNPKDNFKGDLRNIRIYGRNLSPSEFL